MIYYGPSMDNVYHDSFPISTMPTRVSRHSTWRYCFPQGKCYAMETGSSKVTARCVCVICRLSWTTGKPDNNTTRSTVAHLVRDRNRIIYVIAYNMNSTLKEVKESHTEVLGYVDVSSMYIPSPMDERGYNSILHLLQIPSPGPFLKEHMKPPSSIAAHLPVWQRNQRYVDMDYFDPDRLKKHRFANVAGGDTLPRIFKEISVAMDIDDGVTMGKHIAGTMSHCPANHVYAQVAVAYYVSRAFASSHTDVREGVASRWRTVVLNFTELLLKVRVCETTCDAHI